MFQPKPVEKQGEGLVAPLEVGQGPEELDSGCDGLAGIQDVGLKATKWKEPGRPLGEISFDHIAADSIGLMAGPDITPAFACLEVDGRIDGLAEQKPKTAKKRLGPLRVKLEIAPQPKISKLLIRPECSPQFVLF